MDKYGFRLFSGILFICGENLQPEYIDNAVDSVEDVCIYSANRNFYLLYMATKISGLFEYIRVRRIAKRYNLEIHFVH